MFWISKNIFGQYDQENDNQNTRAEIREENLAWRFRLLVRFLELYFKADLILVKDLLSKSNSDWRAANFSSIFAECSNVGEGITDISAGAFVEQTATSTFGAIVFASS